ncbi:MAG: hypothetical protein WBE57_20955, partial [Xanthobacteraceae bacterium]
MIVPHPRLKIHVAEQRSSSLVRPAQINLPKNEIESRSNLTNERFLQQPAKALAAVKLADKVLALSARQASDVDMIHALPDMKDIGPVIVDDLHRLPDSFKERLS